MRFLSLITRRFVFLLNGLVALLFLGACLVGDVSAGRFWPISFLGLAFPILLALVLGFLVLWLLVHPRYALLDAACLVFGYKSLMVFFAWKGLLAAPAAPPGSSFRVMSYNVRYFKDFDYSPARNRALRGRIMALIAQARPDILCLQEFYTSESPLEQDNKTYISDSLGLPYRYFSSDHNFGNRHSGSIVFSRYPILEAGKLSLLQHSASESVIYADILRGRDTLRVFTLHLQSIYLNHRDLAGIQRVKHRQDTGFAASRVILGKLRKAFLIREQQARTVASYIRQSPYPVLLCGDFNDTPDSYAYWHIRGSLQDAFLERGLGVGRTYAGIFPTLRIDYILASGRFRVLDYRRIARSLSDHFPILADLSLQPRS